MCGIVGYIGCRQVQPILLAGMARLEYRGYDSAGIAVLDNGKLEVRKAEGRLANLSARLEKSPLRGTLGIGHTRWATHGSPSDANSHPHTDMSGSFSVVHNGIIENYLKLKDELERKGVRFSSETDTEVIVHLIADLYRGSLEDAVREAAAKLQGAYSLGVVTSREPDKLIAVRQASPLVIGLGQGENFIASDIAAFVEHTRDVVVLDEGEMAVVTRNHVTIVRADSGRPVSWKPRTVEWNAEEVKKGPFDHYMLKEIYEQPDALRKTMADRTGVGNQIVFRDGTDCGNAVKGIEKIYIVACGTAYHAGLVGKTVIETLARIPAEADIASEFRYRNPIVTEKTLIVVVSQSGETADTIAAMHESRSRGAKVLAITNVATSTVARDADYVFPTSAGPEIAVASTKAYTTQLMAFMLLGLSFAREVGRIGDDECKQAIETLKRLPYLVEKSLEHAEGIKWFAESIRQKQSVFFIGRGLDYPVALEGSLKLKEISYIHSEAYAAGELKHGTLALIEEGTPVIALVTQPDLYEKSVSNIKEVKARGARVMGITADGNVGLLNSVDEICFIPKTEWLFAPMLAVIPLQLLSYYTSLSLGNDIDKPRNLAKSVTVE